MTGVQTCALPIFMTFFMWAFCSGITNYIAWTIVLFIKNSFVQPIGKLILRHKKAKKLNELTRANMQKLIYDVCSKKLPDLLESQPLIQIRTCFDAKTILDGSVKRILNIDYFSFSLPIDLFQRIKEVTDRRKFRVFRPPNEIYYTRLYLTITIILFLIEYCLLLVMSDLRRNYLMDSPCSYGVIIYTALLMMTYSDLKHETLTIFTMTANLAFAILNLVVTCIDMPLYFRSGYFAAARFMVAPIGSDFFFGALSAVLINLTFAIQLMAAGRTPSNQFPLSLFIARRALGFIYYIILIVITKSRYDKLIKLTFVSQERIKAAMASSNEKLMLLMPKFVLDRINYFEMSSKYLLANC